jgi:AhpD family alkylhydroperoxidase
MKAMAALESYVQKSGIEPALIDLIKTRASQINGCAYCIHMHTREARARGESEERLYLLDAWHEAPLCTARERAALAWTEAVTLVSQTHVPDAVYDEARPVLRGGIGQADPRRRRDQWLEPARHQLPVGASDGPARSRLTDIAGLACPGGAHGVASRLPRSARA